MFEAHVLYLLRKYLGEYVEGLSIEALRISVWKGDVVLKDLKLKAEALNSLKLPVTVKAGFVGTITLKVPWKSLGKEPVVVLIDRVFVLAHPAPDGQSLKEEDREKVFEAKLQQIEEIELATLEATTRRSKVEATSGGNSWLGSLIATIIGNLKVTISNVHIRYEDTVSNPGHPFCSGVTLSKLAAVTMDEQGNETFDTSGALDKLRKSLQLQRLALYHDSGNTPWELYKKWEDLNPTEWTEIFQDGIDDCSGHGVSVWAMNRRYLVSPINGVLKYHRLGKQERQDPEIPVEKASLILSDVSLTISEAQYYDGIKLLETISRYKTRVDISHLRPLVPVSKDPHAWWRYAMLAGLQQKKMCYWFSWERIRHLCQLRRRYVQLYATSLQQSNADISENRQIERILDLKVIILWRLLAHAKVESVKSMEASKQKGNSKRSWWSFGWRTSSRDASVASDSTEIQLVEGEKLTKEEWQTINKMLSYQADEDATSFVGKGLQNMIQFQIDVSIGQAAARIIDIHETEVVCGRFEQLHVTTKLYYKSIHCDVSLKFCGLSSPEGSLAESVSSERKTNALEVSFVHAPSREDLDWRLAATTSPCHVTLLMESYERFLEFVKRSNAVSPTVAMETANVLQMKIEQVTRRAQEQLQMVLEEQSRFALDIDLDAPKVRVPMRATGSTSQDSLFLLDFGHFTLHTKEGQADKERQSLYSRFYISGRDMAAFFIDDIYKEKSTETAKHESHTSNFEDVDQFYSLLDRCGMSVIVDQIKIPHPSYPSTRISVQVPNLAIHFSPERYRRIGKLLDTFYGPAKSSGQNSDGCSQTGHVPWQPADLATDAKILVWKGFGNALAEWQPCYLVLSGLYLYVLESEVSQNYQRCSSMAGRQVFEVPSTSVGGSLYSIAVSSRGADIQKALESTNTLIIEFRDDEEKTTWLKELVQATYRASAPPAVDILGEPINSLDSGGPRLGRLGTADLVINGTLVETKLSIYGKLNRERGVAEEALILELLASGGKVNLLRFGGDLTVKTKLHSLKIKDELQGHLSMFPQYLACSVLNENFKADSYCTFNPDEKEMQIFSLEEDDCFKDALPDFMSTPDQSFNAQNLDLAYNLMPNPESCEFYPGVSCTDIVNVDKDQVKGRTGEIFYEAQDNNVSDFVAVTFMTRSPDSPLYDGTDTQMSICMSALEFFCNRPTLVALIEFCLDLSLVNSGDSANDIVDQAPDSNYSKEEYGRALVKGLLGYGKDRVVFNLKMNVDSVCVFLNKEDGSQLAMFAQESFLLDFKVHPSSISMNGTLGNMRLCDMSLGPDHRWGWLCDIRNQGVESLIKFTFQSYSAEDDDYQGYDYSLSGRLSAVRIVFLYRFIQEFTSYFMELASPHTQEVIKFVDKVGDLEWLIQKYEIDGAAAVKLDLSLDTPIIIIPKSSMSEDYMQLDLGQLQVKNSFSWHGCKENDPSAVHLDILHAQIHGINMAIGINGRLGKPMIREGQGIDIEVRRSLRDVFRKVPNISVKVQVGLLHGVMSDKEYSVIINCLYMNLSEVPKLPPSFRGNVAETKESIRMLADKVNLNSQILLSRSIFVLAVEVHYALLALCNGLDEESPLAQIALEGLWVYYRSTSLFEADIYLTIPKFSVLDVRPDTKPEMRLMLGSYSDVSKPAVYSISSSLGTCPATPTTDVSTKNSENATDIDVSNLTMLVMDYRWRSSFQSFVIRIQQPRVLVVLDFLLAVVEYFVPSLGTITGREESLNPKNDPLTNSDDIILSESIYMQRDDIVYLSPRRKLIVDGCGIDEFIYDGCGGTICLSEDVDMKGQSYSGSIITIGVRKRLRFKNVKIENGTLLRKCTYLNNGSSYSVSADDGVEISLLHNAASDRDKEGLVQIQECKEETSVPNAVVDSTTNKMLNFTFEAQVISPEFTFYDSSKLSMDDSLHIEKLLRAKMDLSFMYASKEKDTWARCLVKDLTIEAGSGLVIMEPVDISGGYTSVKDKTNISVTSTNICIHLSLSVASLLLKLQNQALAALQFGNVNPLTSCTNFKRLWVSPKGELPGYSFTFWRPQAPSNYAILGDCVTSRSIPPSQAVVAVSNTYGRVRKPLSFKLICSLCNFQEPGGTSNGCSIWMPVAPPGYSALGCVAHIGNQPPPKHIVYCLRSDLVTSANFSDCIYYVQSMPRVLSGLSIWRINNVVGSFIAHNSVECPPEGESFNLHEILLHNSNWHLSFSSHPSSKSYISNEQQNQQQGGNSNSGSSGWDILRSLSKSSCYMSTPHFERIWWDKGCDLRRPISIWRPIPRPGYAVLGDCVTEGLEPPALGLVFKCDNSVISANPVQFTRVAHINRKGLDDAFFWYPIPPPGYASLGCVVTRTDEVPEKDFFCCPRIDLVNQANVSDGPISRSSNSKGSNCWSIWKVDNQACTFLARSDLRKPSSRLAYSITDYVKPRARENISADMKLGSFSFSILDSLCGTMTPLFDTTITNITVATHGLLEAMNAVLICSIAASTFNRQLEAWEPLIEPFDGIFKVETYDTSEHPPSKVGKRVRVAATTPVNLNVSAANLEILTETLVSWSRHNDIEQKSSRKNEESDEDLRQSDDLSYSALDEDDFQKVIVENKLGLDVYLRKVEGNAELLQHDNQVSFLVPPPRFSNKLNTVAKARETRYYVAIQIMESKGLPIVDDGNSHDYFCALRLLTDSKATDQYKLFPQSARTRCVKPMISKINGLDEAYAKWNELFIFEVPEKGLTSLEVEVTNLASKAGKGEVIGAMSVPIGSSSGTFKRAASIKILQQAADIQQFTSYPLRRKGQAFVDEETNYCGCLVISTSYFERNADMNIRRGIESATSTERDVGFCVGLSQDGPWESFDSVLPLSVVPKSLNKNPFAFEVVMRNGKRHAILRALAVIVNDANIKLEVSVCPATMLSNPVLNMGLNSATTVTEEVFENQRYQPISGWGNKSSGSRGNDPGRWSTNDFSYSSKDFFEPPLPAGWRWTSAWKIEKSQFVDGDGWAYGTDFQSLMWPPNSSKASSKSVLDFVRRRRWIRTRQPLSKENNDSMRNVIAVINPGSSMVLPWTSMVSGMDLCLQVRPFAGSYQEIYTWGQMVTLGSGREQSTNQQAPHSRQNTVKHSVVPSQNSILRLNQLEKKDMLSYSNPGVSTKQYFWLSVGIDASVLHTELNAPVYDWKISFNSALRLENKLPYEAEYAIWERAAEGNMVERQRGIISSGGNAFVYSADIRKPIYLTLFVQGGWILEKDAILVMDLLALDHVSSFWMVQQRSNRRLRVSVEHDLGGTDAAPKTVRLFVPYWIQNDSAVPLSYRIVEVEPLENADADSLLISRAVKSAKFALKQSSKSLDRKNTSIRRNIQILEVIKDSSPKYVMLSPQDYVIRGGSLSFQSRGDAFTSAHVGVSVAISHSVNYSPGISLLELESKERVNVKAFASDGSYYRLSAHLKMASDRTKVVHFLHQTLFINRIGSSISLSQCNTKTEEWFHPDDPPKFFKWQSSANELLKLRVDGYKWSTPFSIENDGVMCVCMRSDKGNDQMFLRVEVRSGTKSSCYEVVFCPASSSSPYRIENRSMFLPVHFRQVGGTDDSWQSLPANAAAAFFWEDLGRQRLLEVLVDGAVRSELYNIDEVMDHTPMLTSGGPTKAVRLTCLKEGKIIISQISDWMPENETPEGIHERVQVPVFQSSELDYKQSSSTSDTEFHVSFELTELGLSIIDHMPEEILYLSVQNLLLSYSSGLGSGITRFKIRMHRIQVDNQLPFSPMPVLLRPHRLGDQLDYTLKFSMTMQTNNSLDFCVYPYVGLQVPDNSAFLVNIHEPIMWRLHEMFHQAKLSTVFSSSTSAVSVDPIIKIGLLNISEIRFKVSMAMSPAQRPRGVLGFWSSLMTALGNMEHMPVRIAQRFHEEVCMRQSAVMSTAVSSIQKDLLSQPLRLLSGVDILGNASSALSNMSKGVAALSMDKKFIQSRQKQDSKGVEDIGDVIREGGGALAKGFFRGVTGILTKPLEGAKSSGVEGFVQGVGKGLIGAAAQPVSGVLDLLSKTTEGANAVRMKISSAITSEEQLLRIRLPRVIGGDNLLRPYDEYKASGQAILQLAECGTFLGQVDLFKVRGKFAFTDAYEDHFLLPKGKILLVTHRRVILLQQPTNIMVQRKFNPARDPCSVLWDVLLDDIVTMELANGKKDGPGSLPSRLILYLQVRSTEPRETARMIKCSHGSEQATEIYLSIQQALNAYGPNASKDMQKRKVPRPYTPCGSVVCPEVHPKEDFGSWVLHDDKGSVPIDSAFGIMFTQPQLGQEHLQ